MARLNLALLADNIGAACCHRQPGKLCCAGFLLMTGTSRDQRRARFMSGLDQGGEEVNLLGSKRCLLKRNPLLDLLFQDRKFQHGDILAEHGYTRRQRIGAGGEKLWTISGAAAARAPGKLSWVRPSASADRRTSAQRNLVIDEIRGHILIFQMVENIAFFDNLTKLGFDHHHRAWKPALHELHLRQCENHPFSMHLLIDLGIDGPGHRDNTEDRDQDIENLSFYPGALRRWFRRGMIHWRTAHGHRRRTEQLVENPANRKQGQPQDPADKAEGKEQDRRDEFQRKTPAGKRSVGGAGTINRGRFHHLVTRTEGSNPAVLDSKHLVCHLQHVRLADQGTGDGN